MNSESIKAWLIEASNYSQVDAKVLGEHYFDGLSPTTRTHPLILESKPGLVINLIHPNMDVTLLSQCAQMITSLFTPSWSASWLNTMHGIVSRIPIRTVTDKEDYDFGTTYERSAYFVYTIGNQVVATSGFYKDILKTNTVYGGLFAVRQDYWGTEIVVSAFRHILKTIRNFQKVDLLEIFTSDSKDNLRVHRFYEKNYFEKLDTTFVFRGELQRVYSLSLTDDSLIWQRLARFKINEDNSI